MTIDDNDTPLGHDPHARGEAETFAMEDDLVANEEDLDVSGDAIDSAYADTEDLDEDLDAASEDYDDEAEISLLQALGIDLDNSDETGAAPRDLIASLDEDDLYDDEMAA